MKYAVVAVGIDVDKVFHYAIPESLSGKVDTGFRVLVPFRNRKVIGFVVSIVDETPIKDVKEIASVLDSDPILNDDLLRLTKWVSDYYLSGWGIVIKTAIPPIVKPKMQMVLCLAKGIDYKTIENLTDMPPKQAEALKVILREGEIPLNKASPLGLSASAIRKLIDKGILYSSTKRVYRSPYSVETSREDIQHKLNPEQKKALRSISEAIDRGVFETFLLHGVTGSGKTEVYMHAVEHTITARKEALILVPEIALTAQITERFMLRFGQRIAVLHSGLSEGERSDAWMRVKQGGADIVIGARSAVFASVNNLGLIVVDEEQDTSYKQEEGIRYNARDVAIMRGKISNAVVVLGTATPSIESYFNAIRKKYIYLRLPKRIDEKPLPDVSIIDITREPMVSEFFSEMLISELKDKIEKNEQALLLLNRRGYSPFVICRDCGFTVKCRNCSITLTYHKKRAMALCHYCGFTSKVDLVCPNCRGIRISYIGIGTEKVVDELNRLLSNARVSRMDRDTTYRKMSHHKIIRGVERGDVDILVGTQMVAKGHDLPNITLAGVILGDTGLNLPDFRAAERTFHILTQLAGRAGRGITPGKVIIQTLMPSEPVMQFVKSHDYTGFYQDEEKKRRQLGYPPFKRFVRLLLHGAKRDKVENAAYRLREISEVLLKEITGCDILGPAPAPIERLKGRYRWHILLRGDNAKNLHKLIRNLINNASELKGCKIEIDVDPVSMM